MRKCGRCGRVHGVESGKDVSCDCLAEDNRKKEMSERIEFLEKVIDLSTLRMAGDWKSRLVEHATIEVWSPCPLNKDLLSMDEIDIFACDGCCCNKNLFPLGGSEPKSKTRMVLKTSQQCWKYYFHYQVRKDDLKLEPETKKPASCAPQLCFRYPGSLVNLKGVCEDCQFYEARKKYEYSYGANLNLKKI